MSKARVDLDKEELKRLRQAGWTLKDIGMRMGVSHMTVRKRLIDYGLHSARTARLSDSMLEDVKNMRANLQTYRQIAGKYNVSESQVHLFLNRHNLTRKSANNYTATDGEKEQIRKLYLSTDLTLAKIARQVGIKRHQVVAILKELGLMM